jgi:hypothetical protein
MAAMLPPRQRTPDDEPLARDSTACPECEGSLVDGQGLAVCTAGDCRWTGVYE